MLQPRSLASHVIKLESLCWLVVTVPLHMLTIGNVSTILMLIDAPHKTYKWAPVPHNGTHQAVTTVASRDCRILPYVLQPPILTSALQELGCLQAHMGLHARQRQNTCAIHVLARLSLGCCCRHPVVLLKHRLCINSTKSSRMSHCRLTASRGTFRPFTQTPAPLAPPLTHRLQPQLPPLQAQDRQHR